jgi:hypothetical protein
LVKHAKADFHLEKAEQDLSTVTLHQFTEAIIAGEAIMVPLSVVLLPKVLSLLGRGKGRRSHEHKTRLTALRKEHL